MEKISLGVVFGGRSVEHEVSVISAVQAMNALDKDKYKLTPLYIDKKGAWYTGEKLMDVANYTDLPALLRESTKIIIDAESERPVVTIPAKGLFSKPQDIRLDVILPVTHGAHVEDGCLQGLFEMKNIAYAGPGVLAAAVGMDKIMMKAVLMQAKIPMVPYLWFSSDSWYDDKEAKASQVEQELGYPVIVKPANLGSSVGINRASNREELFFALDEAANYTSRLLVEQCVTELREINCAVLGEASDCIASPCEEPITANEILTYKDKYAGGGKTKGMSGSRRQIPADLPEDVESNIKRLAMETFAALDGFGVSRVDFLLDKSKNLVYVNEINTIPGSLSFYLFREMGMPYAELLDRLIDLAFRRHRIKNSLNFSFDTNILKNAGGMKSGSKTGSKFGTKF